MTLDDTGGNERLSFTLFLAIAFHAVVILGISFKFHLGQKVAPTLNITLATHKSKTAPEKTDFLAQHNQKGSGTESELKELSTRTKAEIADINIREVNPIHQQKAVNTQKTKSQLLASASPNQRKVAKNEKTNDETNQLERPGHDIEAPETNPEIASLQAKLDKLRQDLARQPRIRRLTSVSTKSSVDAKYQFDWQQKIETIGNKNFPEEALKNSIFGRLRLSVLILPNGQVEKVELLQSSGESILDDAAIQIVKLSAPFNPFPPEIRKEADKLEIIRTWSFEITGLKTGM